MKEKSMKKKPAKKEVECRCPYCEEDLILVGAPFCSACKMVIVRCTMCLTAITDKDAKTCPRCGEPLQQ